MPAFMEVTRDNIRFDIYRIGSIEARRITVLCSAYAPPECETAIPEQTEIMMAEGELDILDYAVGH